MKGKQLALFPFLQESPAYNNNQPSKQATQVCKHLIKFRVTVVFPSKCYLQVAYHHIKLFTFSSLTFYFPASTSFDTSERQK